MKQWGSEHDQFSRFSNVRLVLVFVFMCLLLFNCHCVSFWVQTFVVQISLLCSKYLNQVHSSL